MDTLPDQWKAQLAALDDGVRNPQRFDLCALADKLVASRKEVTIGRALRAVADGKSFAEPGERESTLYTLARRLHEAWPNAELDSIIALFRPSADVMEDNPGDIPIETPIIDLLAIKWERLDGARAVAANKTAQCINVSMALPDVLDAIGHAFARANPPAIFRQGGLITIDGPATAARLRVEAAQVGDFRNADGEIVHPSRDLMEAFAARPPLSIPELHGRRYTPVLRPDGSVFYGPGYDPVTQVWCDGWTGPHVVEGGHADALAAAERLLGFVEAGQWEEDIDRIAWLAHLLTIAARPAIEGPVPAFPYSAPVSGGGKTGLATCAGILGGGCDAAGACKLADDKELGMKLDGYALGAAYVLDNLRGTLSSEKLETAVSKGVLDVRRMYIGHAVVLWRTVLSVTSNGAQIGHDWARRSIPIALSGAALPATRDILIEARDREDLQADAVAVVSAWLRSGERSTASPLLGFDEWSRVVCGALAWLWPGLDLVPMTRAGVASIVSVRDDSTELLDAIEAALGEAPEFESRAMWDVLPFGVKSGFKSYDQFAQRLHRCSDAARLLRKRKANSVRLWRVERRQQ